MIADTTIKRPIMRYHGGKFRLGPWVIGHFPPHRCYVEPYGGAASVLLQKPRTYAEVYNDLDGEIVNLFRVLRNPTQARELERQVMLTPFAREEFENSYLVDGDPIEQARRTVFRSLAGFGSGAASGQDTGFRNNASRSGTLPAHDWMNYPELIAGFSERLRGVVVENRPAEQVIQTYDSGETLFYIDPPYPMSTRAFSTAKRIGYKKIYRHEMTDEQHAELANLLKSLRGYVVLSGYTCQMYDDLYSGWMRIDHAAHGDSACDRVESLWLNPRCADAQAQKSLFEGV